MVGVANGLRYHAAQKPFEAGCTPRAVQAATSDATLETARTQGKAASQKRLAKAAIAKLERGGSEIDGRPGEWR